MSRALPKPPQAGRRTPLSCTCIYNLEPGPSAQARGGCLPRRRQARGMCYPFICTASLSYNDSSDASSRSRHRGHRRPWHTFLRTLCWSSCVVRLHRQPRSCSHLHQALLSSALCTYPNSGSVTLPGKSSGCASLGHGFCGIVLCAEKLHEHQRLKASCICSETLNTPDCLV